MEEVEIRGVLTAPQFETLKIRLESEGNFEQHFRRLSVEISPGFDPQTRVWNQRTINLRIKKSDQEEKISLKVGDPLHHTLEEYEILTKPSQFLQTLQLFAKLGFDQGLIYFWESWVYEYKGVEVKLSKYTDEYCMWEIEARDTSSLESAQKRVYEMAEELSLNVLTPEEYRKEIEYQNLHIFEEYTLRRVESLLQSKY